MRYARSVSCCVCDLECSKTSSSGDGAVDADRREAVSPILELAAARGRIVLALRIDATRLKEAGEGTYVCAVMAVSREGDGVARARVSIPRRQDRTRNTDTTQSCSSSLGRSVDFQRRGIIC